MSVCQYFSMWASMVDCNLPLISSLKSIIENYLSEMNVNKMIKHAKGVLVSQTMIPSDEILNIQETIGQYTIFENFDQALRKLIDDLDYNKYLTKCGLSWDSFPPSSHFQRMVCYFTVMIDYLNSCIVMDPLTTKHK